MELDLDGVELLEQIKRASPVFAVASLFAASIGIPALARTDANFPFASLGFLALAFIARGSVFACGVLCSASAGYLIPYFVGWPAAPLAVIACATIWPPARRWAYALPEPSRRRVWWIAVITGLGSAVVLWAVWLEPYLQRMWFRLMLFPDVITNTPLFLAVSATAFAAANSVFEEVLWRGAAMSALESSGVAPLLALPIVSISFGIAHLHGVPSGPVGVILTTAFGLAVGALRAWSNSLVPAMVAHFVPDIVLVGALA
ncbi:MAG: CPBP family intramembrane metalloprotease [Candidatus Microbacterium phytovorans]|uniref:CPBP family intramembrane metalloprotease n=1 Tax=Candidatus Microbacterium phytovorans TaxID=3121374 RepID=A0AAJ5W4H8_9MICO|nr:CPBP family intramembrane glutamic endopeptidase [Microbacterium sp.]WEK14581.1 MAG: CPBP family intramembrane metalloprotease [Microbacterium sp.]